MKARQLLDAIGVPLRPGQRVLYASAGIHSTGALQLGTITRAYVTPFGGGERIVIRRDGDRKTICVTWSRRVVVIEQPPETEADAWLREQLSKLDR